EDLKEVMLSKKAPLLDGLEQYYQGKLPDPYPLYRQLREEDPVHWSAAFNGWLLSRYDDVKAALHDPQLVSGQRVAANMERLPENGEVDIGPFSRILAQWMINLDPPDHTRLRTLANKAFTPRMVESSRSYVQATADQLLDALERRGEMEV